MAVNIRSSLIADLRAALIGRPLVGVTIEPILQAGGEPSRDAIAERVGVGIGTLYRHFPDRQALLHVVARHALEKSISAG